MIRPLILWTFIGFLHLEPVIGQISCYQCNIDSSGRFVHECSDPYGPSPSDHLLPCPQDEPHSCLKAEIYYSHIEVTVRACIPSRQSDTYCTGFNSDGRYPGAKVTCNYCDDNGCNDSSRDADSLGDLVLAMVALAAVNFRGIIFGL